MNVILAAALNIVRAFFIEACAAIGFVLACRVKDIITVVAGAVLFSEHISMHQLAGFSCQLFGIFLYTQVGTKPQLYEGGIIAVTKRIAQQASATTPLAEDGPPQDYGSSGKIQA
eukprot:CAMPEP_0194529548 /NCGR_PEP_ID=MMETSP0253-20130528/66276_1 /TAXON_ID=2966 /ORGANISM="Noctiluca scintillans" /LENGTH=114 /DNA_ID=CAMNT_0039374695 /DNA_START=55 /DNA_END=399 /DNA_ORIENTATION=+